MWLSFHPEILPAAGIIGLLIFFATQNKKHGFSRQEHLGWITEIWLDLMTWKSELLSEEQPVRTRIVGFRKIA